MKKLIRGSWNNRTIVENKLARALLQYRNKPIKRDGASTAQKLFGHPVQDTIPIHKRTFSPEWQKKLKEIEHKRSTSIKSSKKYYNTHAHELPSLQMGKHVAVQNVKTGQWDTHGVIVSVDQFRTYPVKTESGHILERNRRYLRKRITAAPTERPSVETRSICDDVAPTVPPRRSKRNHCRPNRLVEDPN